MLETIITSALVATIANAIINAWLESRKSKETATIVALRAAVELEGYARSCVNKLSHDNVAHSSDGYAGAYVTQVHELPIIPVVAGFMRPRKVNIANRVLTLPQDIVQANQDIDFYGVLVLMKMRCELSS